MRPASTFILSSVDSHALAGFPKELKPCVDEALQDPKILRKILTNEKIASSPQFGRMMVGKMAKEHPTLMVDAMTHPNVIERLEEVAPRLARKIEIIDDKFAADERIEAVYDNASANLLKLAARQDPQAMLDFAMNEHVLPVLMDEDPSLPGDLANIFEEEFGELGTLDDEDEAGIRALRELSTVTELGDDTLWSPGKWLKKKYNKYVKPAVKYVKKKYQNVKKAGKKLYNRGKNAVRNGYNKLKQKGRNAYNRAKTYAREKMRNVKQKLNNARTVLKQKMNNARAALKQKMNNAKNAMIAAKNAAVARMKKMKDAAMQKAADAKAAALARAAKFKQMAADKAKKFSDMVAAKRKKVEEALAATRQKIAAAGQRIKDAKDAAIAKTKKVWGGIKGGVNNMVQKAKNVVGNAANTYNKYKTITKHKYDEYKAKVNDFKAAAKAKIDAKILKTKQYLAKKGKAAWEAAKSAKDWSKQKLVGGLKLAGKAMKGGYNLLKKGKDLVVGAGKGALNLGLGGVKAIGSGLYKAGAGLLSASFKAGQTTRSIIDDILAARAAAQEEAEEEPQDQEIDPNAMYDEGGMYDDMGGQMMDLPAEEPYPEEGMYDEELPPGAECRDGEEMTAEKMVCVGGQWKCKEGAEMEIEPGMSMTCVNGEWATPDMGEGEPGLPDGHACKIGDREELTPGVYMTCVNGQWEMPQEPDMPPGGDELPPGAECREGDEMPIDDMHSMRCCDGKWKSVTKGTWGDEPVPGDGELPPGAVCKEGETVTQSGVSLTCVSGQWQETGMPGDGTGVPMPPGEGSVPWTPPGEDMPPGEYDEGVPPEFMPHDPTGDGSSPGEGGYIAPDLDDVSQLPEDIRQEIADEIQDVTIPEADEWSEEGPIPGTVVPKPETGLPAIPVPIFGINVSKMVGWTGRTIEFQEIIPGLRPTPIPWVIPPLTEIPIIGPMFAPAEQLSKIAEIPIIGPMLSSIEKIPLLPGFIVRGEDGSVENTGMRLPTIPRGMIGLPALPIPEPLPEPDFGYDPATVVTLPDEGPLQMPTDEGPMQMPGEGSVPWTPPGETGDMVTWDDSYAHEEGWDDAYGEPMDAQLSFRREGYRLGDRERGYPL